MRARGPVAIVTFRHSHTTRARCCVQTARGATWQRGVPGLKHNSMMVSTHVAGAGLPRRDVRLHLQGRGGDARRGGAAPGVLHGLLRRDRAVRRRRPSHRREVAFATERPLLSQRGFPLFRCLLGFTLSSPRAGTRTCRASSSGLSGATPSPTSSPPCSTTSEAPFFWLTHT